jgi:hypothetical protein
VASEKNVNIAIAFTRGEMTSRRVEWKIHGLSGIFGSLDVTFPFEEIVVDQIDKDALDRLLLDLCREKKERKN